MSSPASKAQCPVPRIGVSYLTDEARGAAYLAALRAAGAEPIVLATAATCPQWLTEQQATEFFDPANPSITGVDTLDGLLLTGGGDFDPILYREVIDGSDIPNWPRDHLEMAQLQRARQRGLPILGICRGYQFLNAAMGGSLIQHLPSASIHRTTAPKQPRRSHPIRLDPESRLARILVGDAQGEQTVVVNSSHHQAVSADRLAPGLVESARSLVEADLALAVLEALETPATRAGQEFIIGVQWHPERIEDPAPPAPGQTISFRDMSDRLFQAFVQAAR